MLCRAVGVGLGFFPEKGVGCCLGWVLPGRGGFSDFSPVFLHIVVHLSNGKDIVHQLFFLHKTSRNLNNNYIL